MASGAAPSRCPLHGRPLVRRRVPVAYGLIQEPPGYRDACRASFPHADAPSPGGCALDEGSPRWAWALVCPACCAARDAWRAAHPDGP
jgi:hypothetical protein